jgi:hypothetical protein
MAAGRRITQRKAHMVLGIESLLFLLGGIVLAVILVQLFGRGAGSGRVRGAGEAAVVKLERQVRPQDSTEETRLLINDQPILTASSAGVRLADYADEVEQLEMVATRIASALNVNVELARLPGKGAAAQEEAVQVRRLPRSQQDETAR